MSEREPQVDVVGTREQVERIREAAEDEQLEERLSELDVAELIRRRHGE